MQNLEVLDLSGNQLTTLKSGVFSQLFKVKRIYLRDNQFKEIPNDTFDNLPCLKSVELHCGEATESDRYTIVRIGENSIKIPGQIKMEGADKSFHSLKRVWISRTQKP